MRCGALGLLFAGALGGCAVPSGTDGRPGYNDAEIRAAERALATALEASDPTAWVYSYTEDAVFVFPGAPAVQGRNQLLQMARAMKPLSAVSIKPLKTEVSGNIATVYCIGSWTNGRAPGLGSVSTLRALIVWRKEADGQWRVAQELLNAGPAKGE